MKYRVLRVWPSKTKLRQGQVIEDPTWRTLGSLKRLKYIEEVVEDVVVEAPKVRRKNGRKQIN